MESYRLPSTFHVSTKCFELKLSLKKSKKIPELIKTLFKRLILVLTVQDALKLSPEEFKSKFGREKPSSDTEVIFHCMKGGRAQKAMDAAIELGFKK